MTVSETIKPTSLNHYLNQPFSFPCGVKAKNRILKSAMSEALATISNSPTDSLVKLYEAWAMGGTGVIVTGNIMIDRKALGEPNNVVVEDERDMATLRRWALAGTKNGAQLWAQLNHPGKQSPRGLCKETVSPSAVPFDSAYASFFPTPRALSENEIENIIERFGTSAEILKKAGFTGVQIHGAHGYLVSQFLSSHHNIRTDKWGGSLENRMRFVLAILENIRKKVGKDFPISIKLNSADFQKGGFEEHESIKVMKNLANAGIDLIEISGGTYEAPAMAGLEPSRESTKKREAYFLDFAEKARDQVSAPICVTGGFRSVEGMATPIKENKLDFTGIARPLSIDPDYSNKLLRGQDSAISCTPRKTGIKKIDNMGLMEVAWYARQLKRISMGKTPNPNENNLIAFIKIILSNGLRSTLTRMRA